MILNITIVSLFAFYFLHILFFLSISYNLIKAYAAQFFMISKENLVTP